MTCNDCIYFEACRNLLELFSPKFKGKSLTFTKACNRFKNKADFEEVKHGKWKIKQDDYECEYMMCSVCKEEFYPFDADTVDTTPNYCSNCGAKMDGERKSI